MGDLYPRIQKPLELARDAQAAGLRAIFLKTHNFPTVSLALLTRDICPAVGVFGSIACNYQIGGINPIAVEAAIKYGARQV